MIQGVRGPPMPTGTIQEALRVHLRAARLTQAELAERVESDQALHSRIERGEPIGRPELRHSLAGELKNLASHDLPANVSQDGYVQLPVALRAVSKG